jgi:hypothetical protein
MEHILHLGVADPVTLIRHWLSFDSHTLQPLFFPLPWNTCSLEKVKRNIRNPGCICVKLICKWYYRALLSGQGSGKSRTETLKRDRGDWPRIWAQVLTMADTDPLALANLTPPFLSHKLCDGLCFFLHLTISEITLEVLEQKEIKLWIKADYCEARHGDICL